MQFVPRLRNDRGFEPVGGADKVNRCAAFERIGDGDRRIEVAAGAAAGENDGHARVVRRFRATFAISATATQLTTSELPPNEMNGSGTPVTGQEDETTPMFTKA